MNNPESAIATTSFDQLAEKMAKKRAKLRKELKALHKGTENIAKVATAKSKRPREEAPVGEGASTQLP